jgi:hypothetical protein
MYETDRKYLSRFALDPATEYGLEDLCGSDLSYDDEMDLFDVENKPNTKDSILEDDFLFEN